MSFLGNVLKSIPLVGDIARGIEYDKAASKVVVPDDPTYVENPEIRARLAMAKTLIGARRPGAAAAMASIYTNGANTVNNINNNATTGAQALVLGIGTQGVTNNAITQQAVADEQFAQQARQELYGAQDAVANEGRMVYNDLVRKRYNAVNERNQYRTASDASFANFGNTVANIGLSAVSGGWLKKKNPLSGFDDATLQNGIDNGFSW